MKVVRGTVAVPLSHADEAQDFMQTSYKQLQCLADTMLYCLEQKTNALQEVCEQADASQVCVKVYMKGRHLLCCRHGARAALVT